MSYRVIKTTSHQQWLDERKKGVGSSEAGTIMGKGQSSVLLQIKLSLRCKSVRVDFLKMLYFKLK